MVQKKVKGEPNKKRIVDQKAYTKAKAWFFGGITVTVLLALGGSDSAGVGLVIGLIMSYRYMKYAKGEWKKK